MSQFLNRSDLKLNTEKFTSENQLTRIFPDKKNELKDYFKKNKPDLKERDDLIKPGNYCNELYK